MFSENSHETEEIRETKKIYSKGYEFYIWAIYAVHPFYHRILFIETARIQK